jgi:hypothetical protein
MEFGSITTHWNSMDFLYNNVPVLHYSNTPLLQQTALLSKALQTTPEGKFRHSAFDTSFYFLRTMKIRS